MAKRSAEKAHNKSRGKVRKRSREDGVYVTSKMLAGGAAALIVIYLVYTYGAKPASSSNQTGVGPSSDSTPVDVIILNDARCGGDCDVSSLVSQLRNVFPNLNVKNLDLGSPEGAKLYQDTGTTLLPAVFFDKSVASSSSYPTISKYLDKAGNYLSMRIGANWDPYCDPTVAHCGEERCSQRVGCRPEINNSLSIYIMSQCPYGKQAMLSMKDVLKAFNGEINFSVGYIGQVDQNGNIVSLHGPAEVDEDLRGICAETLYPDSYLNYMWCRINDTGGNWTACANSTGIDNAKLSACAGGNQGKSLLLNSFGQAQSLAIYSSPTFLVNNKRTFSALSSRDIQAGLCGMNSNDKGCQAALSNETSMPQGSCG